MNKVPNTAAVPLAVPALSEPLECTGHSSPAQFAAPFLAPQLAGDTFGAGDARPVRVARLEESVGLRPGRLTGPRVWAPRSTDGSAT